MVEACFCSLFYLQELESPDLQGWVISAEHVLITGWMDSKGMPPKLECAHESFGGLVKMQCLIQ